MKSEANTTGLVVLTAAIVLVGSKIKNPKAGIARPAIGAFFVAIFLSVLSEIDDKLARQFAVLILVVAVFTYGIPIANRAGLLDKRDYR